MSEELEVERGDIRDNGRRPPRAVVGSQRVEEEIFGRLFDRTVVSRIWDFVRPYRRQLIISVIAVLIFTATQIAIPLIISYAIDNGLLAGPDGQAAMRTAMMAFGLAITISVCYQCWFPLVVIIVCRFCLLS